MHPAYSPKPATSDVFLVKMFENQLSQCFAKRHKGFYESGIMKLPSNNNLSSQKVDFGNIFLIVEGTY